MTTNQGPSDFRHFQINPTSKQKSRQRSSKGAAADTSLQSTIILPTIVVSEIARTQKKPRKIMAKKKQATGGKKKQQSVMDALDAVSSSDDSSSLPPESEWNAEARALKAALTKAGALEEALRKGKEDDGSSFEEATLDDTDASSEEEQEEAATTRTAPKASIEKVADDGAESGSSEDESDDDEEAEEEESVTEEPASSTSAAHNNKNAAADPPQRRAVRAKALQVVTTALVAETKDWPWAETFQVVPTTPLPFGAAAGDDNNETAVSIHDDLKREVAFYDCALEAVLEAKEKCQQAGIPFSRPDDFFAEMVKTDGA